MKSTKYHTVRTVPKSNRKTVETLAKWIPLTHIQYRSLSCLDTPNTHIQHRSLSCLGTGTSIKQWKG